MHRAREQRSRLIPVVAGIVALVVVLVAAAVTVPAAPAAAGTVTQANACRWTTGQLVPVDLTVSGQATPAAPGYLDPVTLGSVEVSGALPWWAATVAYEAGIIQAGPNTLPLTVELRVGATSATPSSRVLTRTTTVSVDFDPLAPFTEAGQAGQLIEVSDLAMPSSSWTRNGQEPVKFRQIGLTIKATAGLLVDAPVLQDCFPATWSSADQPVATPVTALPFASAGLVLADPTFTDVPYGHDFFLDIEWLASEGITQGYPDGTFGPTRAVTRQAFVSFLYEAAGAPAFTPPAQPTFGDVGPGHRFHLAIEWAAQQGIVAGFSDGSFRPDAVVTRQAAATWLFGASGESWKAPATATFADVPTTHPFFAAVEWLVAEDVASGFGDGTFRPGNPLARQAAAAWFHRSPT